MKRIVAAVAVAVACACGGSPRHIFRCSDGTVLQARYSSDSVTLRLPDGSATLPIALSGSGARYANDTLEFWEHAGTARLTRRGKIIHDRCRPDK